MPGNIQPTDTELWRNRKSERSITSKELELVIKNLPTNKNPEFTNFTCEFYQTFKEYKSSNSSKN